MSSQTEIDDRQAQDDLESVRQTMAKIKKALDASYAGPMLILWGSLAIAAYTACHFYMERGFAIFMGMNLLGGIGSTVIIRSCRTNAPLKSSYAKSLDRKIYWLWFFLFIYVGIWLTLLSPFDGTQMNAVILTAVMFAYAVMGLFYESRFMTVLGIAITAATLVAFFAFRPWYYLLMAVCAGGGILFTGLYIRLRWK